MDADSFTAALGDIFEHSPWVARGAAHARPFNSVAALHAAMVGVVNNAEPAQQLALLCAHPELAGQAARAGDITDASKSEQAGAGLKQLSPAEMQRIDEMNRAYGSRFGHPFIIAVRNHTKHSIFAAFEKRLANDAATERGTALNEVFAIAKLRLDALLAPAAEQVT